MTECNECGYLIGYPTGERKCLMKQEFCIIDGETSYPKNCEHFKKKL